MLRRCPAIDVAGIDMHIGSQITELEPFEKAFKLMADLTARSEGPTATTSATSTWAADLACPIAAPMTCRRIRMNMPPW